MNLTLAERVILCNQYRIMAHLGIISEACWTEHRTILERAYSDCYDRLADGFAREDVSPSVTQFVRDTLDLFDAMDRAFAAGRYPEDEPKFIFPGFDEKTETDSMAFAAFLINVQEKWSFLGIKKFNSHIPMKKTYMRMLNYWMSIPEGNRFSLTKDQVSRILSLR